MKIDTIISEHEAAKEAEMRAAVARHFEWQLSHLAAFATSAYYYGHDAEYQAHVKAYWVLYEMGQHLAAYDLSDPINDRSIAERAGRQLKRAPGLEGK